MVFKVHKFNTKDEVLTAIDLINSGESIPKNNESHTTTYCNFNKESDFFYIIADDVTISYLGNDLFDLEPFDVNNF